MRTSGRGRSPRLSVYRLDRGRWVVATTDALRLSFCSRPGAPPELSGPLLVVGVRYPQRAFLDDLHTLADAIAHNGVAGPGDHLALEDGSEDLAG